MNEAYLKANRTSEGDECFTPRYVVEPIVKYLKAKNFKVVWCPFDTPISQYARVLYREGFDVRVGHLNMGLDFFKYDCPEADVIVSNPPYSCYSSDTEVLTLEGWKLFQDITLKDKVLSVNGETKEICWTNIREIICKDVDEELYHFKNKNMDLLVTSDHRMFAYNRYTNKLDNKYNGDIPLAKDIGLKHYMPKEGYVWQGYMEKPYLTLPFTQNPPKSRVSFYPEINIPLEDWLPFFGLWLADGFVSTYKGTRHGYTIGIKQGENNWDNVERILNILPYKYSKYINKKYEGERLVKANYAIYNKQLWDYLTQFGKSREKFVPTWIKNLPCDYLKLFMEGYTLGDSFKSYITKNPTINYSSVSKFLMDDIQEILLKLGNICVVNKAKLKKNDYYWKISFNSNSISNRAMYKMRTNSVTKENYKGKVWCLNLAFNSIFLVRRNGKMMFSGNCKHKVLKRLYELDKPFAMLLPSAALQSKQTTKLYMEYGLEYLGFDARPCFYTEGDFTHIKTSNHFASGYFCRNVLPEKLIFEELKLIQEPYL